MTVRATYRLQFTAAFRFADGAALAPYLAALGISHVYASPIFAARPGSTHGYDVTDYNRLNPELGTEDDFHAMVRAFRDKGLGLILDFVPNHMGIGGAENAYWDSVLEWGPESPYAHWFDIDWNAPAFPGKVLFPFLGQPYGVALAEGELRLKLDDAGRLAVWAHDTHRLPICPHDYAQVMDRIGSPLVADFDAMEAAGPGDPRWAGLFSRLAQEKPDLSAFAGEKGDRGSWTALDALIARQHWRASKFNLDGDAINYRRFFTISDLAGVRVERPEVFEETHKLILSLLRDGVVDGIRIDHIDGLLDPKGYCLRLRQAVGRPFPLYVEKILGPEEHLPADWETDGTTGYEFANEVVSLVVDPRATEALSEAYAEFTGRTDPPVEIVYESKLRVLQGPMAAEAVALTARFAALGAQVPEFADIGQGALRQGISQVIAALDVYRTYADANGLAPEGRARITDAIGKARPRVPELDPAIFDLIASILTLDLADRLPEARDAVVEAGMRFQQLSGPVMAKGLEDRSLYRFNRMIALNEVGSEPGHFNLPVAGFHVAQATRARVAPRNMLGTSSHDTKRGEDARMRIAAISAHVPLWRQKVEEWHGMLADAAQPIDRNEEYFFYQLLLGAWPENVGDELSALADRVEAAMLKSVREAGANSRWVFGDEKYEANLCAFIRRALAEGPFLESFQSFAAELAPLGEANSLIQTTLKLTLPGVPDIYQGAEMWEQSLVDPDNRRPVHFPRRTRLLERLSNGPVWEEGRPAEEIKLALIGQLLRLRAEQPALFAEGSYEPVAAQGPAAESFLGFIRQAGDQMLFVGAALHGRAPQEWSGTELSPSDWAARNWQSLIDGNTHQELAPADLFRHLPVAVLRAV